MKQLSDLTIPNRFNMYYPTREVWMFDTAAKWGQWAELTNSERQLDAIRMFK